MKIFLSYRYTGEDIVYLGKKLVDIQRVLEMGGYDVYCSFSRSAEFKKLGTSHREILMSSFKELEKSDCCLFWVHSGDKSEGMLLEAGYGMAKGKSLIMLAEQGYKTVFLSEMMDDIVEYKEWLDMPSQLKLLIEKI